MTQLRLPMPGEAPPAGRADERIGELLAAGVLADADVHVAEALTRITDDHDPDVVLGIALAARAPREGHVCLQLERVVARGLVGQDERPVGVPLPDVAAWCAALAASPAVRRPQEVDRVAPLVLDGSRLYLDRYWAYEQRLAERLEELATGAPDPLDPVRVAEAQAAIAPEASEAQRAAVAAVATRRLTLLTGGPGTGKTTTVVWALSVLLALSGRPPSIILAAPTGKAAARMAEAVREAVAGRELPDGVAEALGAVESRTLHRLLGWRGDHPTRFRHDRRDPLPYDVVVVDEASMASLPLMAKLVDAIGDGTRLLLVGDRDQLASVDAGAVLADICGPRGSTRTATGPLAAHIVQLTQSHRFADEAGVGRMAAVIRGLGQGDAPGEPEGDDPEAALAELDRQALPEAAIPAPVAVRSHRGDDALPDVIDAAVRRHLIPVVARAAGGASPAGVLDALEALRILAPLRGGRQGVQALNRKLAALIAAQVDGFDPEHPFPIGQPVMVTRNDYQLRLYNGDVGVVVAQPDGGGGRVVAFPAGEDPASKGSPPGSSPVRLLATSRLPATEPVLAMSVHKSQGSQFDHVILVLPEVDSPLLSRELVYTGLTRARRTATLVTDRAILATALRRRVQRASGLTERLWTPPV